MTKSINSLIKILLNMVERLICNYVIQKIIKIDRLIPTGAGGGTGGKAPALT